MRVRVVIPPPAIVAWEEADAHLRLDGDTSQQDLVESLIAAATSSIDGPTGWLGRALGPQTLEARCEAFWCDDFQLPYPPIFAVDSIQYLDIVGALQTVDPAGYELVDREVVPIYGTRWPTARNSAGSVRMRYKAGYPVSANDLTPAVPEAVKRAILLMVGDLYRFRETVVVGTIAADVPMSATVENLLAPYRVFS